MKLILDHGLFKNNRFNVSYGDSKEAIFIIVDEDFKGKNTLGKINKLVILVRQLSPTGQVLDAKTCATIIGMGDGIAGIRTDNPVLRGQVITKDNMEECEIELYE